MYLESLVRTSSWKLPLEVKLLVCIARRLLLLGPLSSFVIILEIDEKCSALDLKLRDNIQTEAL